MIASTVGMAEGDRDAGGADVDGEATAGSSPEHPTVATHSSAPMIAIITRIYFLPTQRVNVEGGEGKVPQALEASFLREGRTVVGEGRVP